MKKVLLLTALLIVFCATFALGADQTENLKFNEDRSEVVFGGQKYFKVGAGTLSTSDAKDVVFRTAYINMTETEAITLFSHKDGSRVFAIVKIRDNNGVAEATGIEDLNCDDVWNVLDLDNPVTLPDCARVK